MTAPQNTRHSLTGALYTGGIHIYQGLLRLASSRNKKARNMLRGRKQTLQQLQRTLSPSDRPVWVHAASLGEFEQGRPLLERLRREYPQSKLVLSFYSPSGYEVRKDWPGADCVVYLPADTPRAMRRLLDQMHPQVAVFVKYEFWGNCLHELRERNIPTFLISAVFRPDQIFFARHGGYFLDLLHSYHHIYVQDEGSRRLLSEHGVDRVSVAGDTRFDRVTDIMRTTHEIPELEVFTKGGSLLTLMAGSSWGADEQVYFPWLKQHPGALKCVSAPHEFDPVRLKAMKQALAPELNAVLLSQTRENQELLHSADVLIIDCFGLLSSAYRYADIAYIGGGFGAGIHNINEAAVYGIPVIFGPRHAKFIEAGELIAAGGGYSINTEKEFAALMNHKLLNTETRARAGAAAGAYIASKLGATDQIFADLKPIIRN